MSILEKLRNKPAHVRRTIAFSVSIFCTGVIALFWVASFSQRVSVTLNSASQDSSVFAPFKHVGELVGTGFSNLANSMSVFNNDKQALEKIQTQTTQPVDTVENSNQTQISQPSGNSAQTQTPQQTNQNSASPESEELVQ